MTAIETERDAKLRLMGQIADMLGEAQAKDAEVARLSARITTLLEIDRQRFEMNDTLVKALREIDDQIVQWTKSDELTAGQTVVDIGRIVLPALTAYEARGK